MGEDLDGMQKDTTGSTGDSIGTSSRKGRQQQHNEPLVPRGLDLLPSMRAPTRLPPTTMSNGDDGDGGGGGTKAAGAGETAAGTLEYVPWIGGTASLGGLKAGKAGTAEAPAPAATGIKDRVRWFPRGLPKEATAAAGRGRDERESAIFNTRASMAIDRLGEHVGETAQRQAEMEIKRREKVSGAVRLA